MDFSIRGISVNWEDMRPDNERVSPSQKSDFAQRSIGEYVRQVVFDFFHYNWQQVPVTARKVSAFCEYMNRLADFEDERFGVVDEDLVLTARAMRECVADFLPAQKGKFKEAEYIFGSDWAFLFEQGSMLDTRRRIARNLVPRVCERYKGRIFHLSETPSYIVSSQPIRTGVVLTDFPKTQHGLNYLVACGRVDSQTDSMGLRLNGDFVEAGVLPFMGCSTARDKMFVDYRKAIA